MADLAPPDLQKHEKVDPGAHDLTESSDEHFSDASEGGRSRSNTSHSPVPVMRVERVDDTPRYGEVPGTNAYNLRTQDAVPDEIEVVPEGTRSRSHSRLSESDRPSTPGGTMIPKTVVEKVEPDKPSHGEVPGTEAYEMRKADAEPDEVLTSPIKTRQNLEGEPMSSRSSPEPHAEAVVKEEAEYEVDRPPDVLAENGNGEEGDDDDGFGDDFDDFEEGEDVDGDDFDDDFVSAAPTAHATHVDQPPGLVDPLSNMPTLSLSAFSNQETLMSSLDPYLRELFPDFDIGNLADEGPLKPPEPLLSDRSSALWSQLVAPPPLQPPNWVKSRIRRLFLVSLGVPVDLDEILPASKQKKLVLPSLNLDGQSPRPSTHILRLRQGNESGVSVSTTDSKPDGPKKERRMADSTRKRHGVSPPPDFDANAASIISGTTEAALENFSDPELQGHLVKLQAIITDASSLLEYWIQRKESALGDKEAFEGVIENLVGFVAKSKAKR